MVKGRLVWQLWIGGGKHYVYVLIVLEVKNMEFSATTYAICTRGFVSETVVSNIGMTIFCF